MSAPRRDGALDGLRALAAVSVVVFHVWLYSSPDPTRPTRAGFLNRLLFECRIGLVLFFVLSGFLLYRAFARAGGPASVRRYLLRRATRILPAYYVALAGTLLLLWGGGGTPGVRLPDASRLWLFAVFGQNYSEAAILRLNPVTWTLCVEMAFYLLLPVLALAGGRTRAGQAALVAALVGLGLGWNAAVHHAGAGAGQVASKAIPAFLPLFACGMAAAAWSVRRRAPLAPRATSALALLGAAAVVGNGVWHSNAAPRVVDAPLAILADLPAAIGFALLVLAAVHGRGRALAWLGARPLASVGVASYGIYLWHVPLILALRRLDLLPLAFLPALALALPVALAAGWLSWRLVEEPALRLLAGRRRRVRPHPVALREREAVHAAP